MTFPKIFSNPRFQWVVMLVGLLILALLIINIFIIGGDSFVFNLNSSLNTPLAILNVVFAWIVWRMMSTDRQNRLMWFSFLTGWILWALAELIWTSYSLMNQEPPYPSFADLFWVLGYFPIIFGLIYRIRILPVKPNQIQRILILIFTVIMVVITVLFVLAPIVNEFESERLLESLINLAYPILDMVVVIVVLRMLFTYQEGDFGFCWNLLALGFIFMTVSDLIFTWSTWQELYYPDMQANLVSRMGVDVPYTLAYLFWFTSVFAMSILYRQTPAPETVRRVRMVRTYGHILFFLQGDDTVFSVSPNYTSFFGKTLDKGMQLGEVLPLPQIEIQNLILALHTRGRLADILVQVKDSTGEEHPATISAISIKNAQGDYAGANVLLRVRVTDPSIDDILSQESKGQSREILLESGSTYLNEIGQFLADYYLVHIQSLIKMATHEGGETLAASLMENLKQTSMQHGWDFHFDPQIILDHTQYPVDLLRSALPVLFNATRDFLSKFVDPAKVALNLKNLDATFNPTVLKDIERYGNKDSDIWFSGHRREDTRQV